MSAPARSSRHEFAQELDRPEAEMNLARAALLVAREEYPQLPLDPYLARLDVLAEEAWDRLDRERAPLVVLREAVANLFERRNLRGNREHYYDPRNSFLNDVLDRGLGIPLTLGIVLLEVGWRLGLRLEGVNFPGHFLVRYRGDALRLLVDPFHEGRIRFPEDLPATLARRRGAPAGQGGADQQGGPGRQPSAERHLRTATKRDMVVRLLTNLKGIYCRAGDHARALAAVERILVVSPTAPRQIRDRGCLLARLGRNEEAVAQLETYLVFAPGAGDAGQVEALLRRIKGGVNP